MQDVEAWWFGVSSSDNSSSTSSSAGQYDSSSAASLRSFFSGCSHGKALFRPSDNIVVGPVIVPCDLTLPVVGANASSTCDPGTIFRMMGAWGEYVEGYVQQVMGVDLSPYKHKIYVVPPPAMGACNWLGVADVGCWGRLVTFI